MIFQKEETNSDEITYKFDKVHKFTEELTNKLSPSLTRLE